MEVKISFYADIDKHDLEEVKRAFNKYGAEIINENFPELKNVAYFKVEEASSDNNARKPIHD